MGAKAQRGKQWSGAGNPVGQPRKQATGRPHTHTWHSTSPAARLQVLICMSALSPMLAQHRAPAWQGAALCGHSRTGLRV